MMMMGMGTPSSQSRIPRPILASKKRIDVVGHDAERCERVIVEALRLFEIAHGERYVVQQRTARFGQIIRSPWRRRIRPPSG
ncbi:hypothetical protein [Inquilinus sp.]|uniref:hypothetical protein n=1 Tax=Inquilinus sp. TaxID=1932117 RepID=UPI003F66C809